MLLTRMAKKETNNIEKRKTKKDDIVDIVVHYKCLFF